MGLNGGSSLAIISALTGNGEQRCAIHMLRAGSGVRGTSAERVP